ncbi:MAG: 6-bladed beta-propeller [Candidatus Krumholzibacteriia bacterium]
MSNRWVPPPPNRRHVARSVSLDLLLLAALAQLACWPSPAVAGSWNGQDVQKHGVLYVMNPATGMQPPATIELRELWRLGGDSESDEEFFGVIESIATDAQGNVYVLDAQLSEIKIYDQNGQYLNTIGREGEGPGEFRRPSDMFFMPDGCIGVMQRVPGKIVMLTPDGEPAGDFPLPAPDGGGFQMLFGGRRAGSHIILVRHLQSRSKGKVTQKVSLDGMDMQGRILNSYTTYTRELKLANRVLEEDSFLTFDRAGRWGVGTDGRVYVLAGGLDYEITLFKADGTLDRVVRREYARRKRRQEEIDELRNLWVAFAARLVIAAADPDISGIYPRDDGTLWVLTSHGSRMLPAGLLGVFDIFDSRGRYVREVALRGQGDPQMDGYFFVGDRLYVVTGWRPARQALLAMGRSKHEAAEATPMELNCYRVEAAGIAESK